MGSSGGDGTGDVGDEEVAMEVADGGDGGVHILIDFFLFLF